MKLAKPLFVVSSLTLAACGGAPGGVEEEVGSVQPAALSGNALSGNALSGNALTGNSLGNNALISNSLSTKALSGNAILLQDLQDPNAREVLKYIVSCALPANATLNFTAAGTAYSLPGGLGLAPEWGASGGSCGPGCQQWVSACVLARVDFLGVKVEISLRGDNPALAASTSERQTYTSREATYFGNIFTWPAERYACVTPGKSQIPRVCGPSLDNCVVDVNATCDRACGAVRSDGSFPNCRNAPGAAPFHGSITVFLKP